MNASDPLPEISVVIPSFRASRTIGACIASLAAQSGPPPFEVVVVDSSPDEDTAVAARAASGAPRAAEGAVAARRDGDVDDAPLRLRIERSADRLFPGSARNRGADLARAPWLLFLDADCVAAPDLLAAAGRARESGAVAVGGAIALAGSGAASARIRHLLEFKESLPGVPARPTWMLPSACLLVERAAFVAHGGFPDTRASEDWLLDWRMWQAGCGMRFDPSLRVGHLTAPGWRALARYLRVLGRASGAARATGGLPGQVLVRWPLLTLGLPFARTARAVIWCARYAPSELAFLAVAWPAYLAMASFWAVGFHAGVRDARRSLAAKGPRA